MGWESNNTFQQVIIVGPAGSVLVYNPATAPGDLADSVAGVGFTDVPGNQVLAGTVNYGSSGGKAVAIQLQNGSIGFNSAATQAGPYNQDDALLYIPGATPLLELTGTGKLALANTGGVAISGTGSAFTTNAVSGSATPVSPAGTVSLTPVMMGLGAAGTPWTFTPASSGKTHVIASCQVEQDTGAAGLTVGVRFGTGAAPANGAADTGTRWATRTDYAFTPPSFGGNSRFPFPFHDILNLTQGTAYWFDVAIATLNAADKVNIFDVALSWAEIQ